MNDRLNRNADVASVLVKTGKFAIAPISSAGTLAFGDPSDTRLRQFVETEGTFSLFDVYEIRGNVAYEDNSDRRNMIIAYVNKYAGFK